MNIDFGLAFTVILTGIIIVFAALIGLTLIIYLIGKVMTAITNAGKPKSDGQPAQQQPAAPAAAKHAAPVQKAVAEQSKSSELVAVITAAIAAMTGNGNFVIRRIRKTASSRPVWEFAAMQENTKPF